MYEDLVIIYSDTTASGSYARASTEDIIDNEEHDCDDISEYELNTMTPNVTTLSADADVFSSGGNGQSSNSSDKINNHRRRRRESQCTEFSEAISAFAEAQKAKLLHLSRDDKFSIGACVRYLQNIGTSSGILMKATKLFQDAGWREAFMEMSKENKIIWLQALMDYDDDEEAFIELVILCSIEDYQMTYIDRRPYRNSSLTGGAYIWEVLKGHPDRCYDLFRMDVHVFLKLCDVMRQKNWLQNSRFLSVEEQVSIFLMTLGHNERNRVIAERFQHLGETISRHFNKVLRVMSKLGQEIIVPPSFHTTPPEIRRNPKYYPWFKKCVGAIDGVHIDAFVPSNEQIPYRGRKSTLTTNVMCACSFDMRFTFVYTGWEGTALDSRILTEAVNNERLKFPMPPPGKYYVVDSGYTGTGSYLTPYPKVRYHLNEYQGSGRQPTSKRELFNYLHSSVRNVIERCYEVLKGRFPILKHMPPYSLEKQSLIMVAACTVHNFIRMNSQTDQGFRVYDTDNLVVEDETNGNGQTQNPPSRSSQGECAILRDEIADAVGAAYGYN